MRLQIIQNRGKLLCKFEFSVYIMTVWVCSFGNPKGLSLKVQVGKENIPISADLHSLSSNSSSLPFLPLTPSSPLGSF
jgi:hypothetical protein